MRLHRSLLLGICFVALAGCAPANGGSPAGSYEIKTSTHSQQIEQAETARVEIAAPYENLHVNSAAAPQTLLSAQVESVGAVRLASTGTTDRTIRLYEEVPADSISLDRALDWTVSLTPDIPLELVITSASGAVTLDLAGVQLSGLMVTDVSGNIEVTLPAPQDAAYTAQIINTSGSSTVQLPAAAARVEVRGSISGSATVDERFTEVAAGVWETADFADSQERIILELTTVSGALTVR